MPTHSPERSKQATKARGTINVTTAKPRDLTASIRNYLNMRRRSSHSSANTKGNSRTTPEAETLDSNLEKSPPVNEVKPVRVAKRVGVTTIVRKLLEQDKITDQKYYGVMSKIADPKLLVACYEEIKGKQGNMTRGTDNETLDGLNYK